MNYPIALLAVGILQTGLPGGSYTPACVLLSKAEIEHVQTATVKETKASDEKRKGLRFAQCVYTTSDFTHSVSLTLVSGATRDAVRAYWKDTFEKEDAENEKKTSREPAEQEARRISGPGDEAFWTGDSRAGALYVLRGGQMLRISVGGVVDEQERIRRSRTLASAALLRLN